MSCRANAVDPLSTGPPASLVRATAVSRMVVPATRVRRNASSSRVGNRGDASEVALELGVGRLHRVLGRGQQVREGPARRRRAGASRGRCGAAGGAARSRGPRCAGVTPSPMSMSADADVVGDDAHADVVVAVGAVASPGQLLRPRRMTGTTSSISYMLSTPCLRKATRSRPMPGVDVLLRQLAEEREVVLAAAVAALVLHEDEVPDLDVAVLVGDRAAVACRTPGRGRRRSPSTGPPGPAGRSTRSCPSCRGAGCARRAGRRSSARGRPPRRRPRRR